MGSVELETLEDITALDVPSVRHAIEIENRTQMLTGVTDNPLEAAKAHQEKRPPVWDPM